MLRLGMLLASMLLWQSQRASIEGTVRNSSTNAPLATVSVELTWVDGERVVSRTATTGENGQFSFRDLPPGPGYELVVRGTGLRATAYGQRDTREPWKPITLAPGEHRTDISINVQTLTQIVGKVSDGTGKPLAGAIVIALKPVYVKGRRELSRAGTTAASLQGEYRLYGLPAGLYYLRVSPQNETSIQQLFTNPGLADRLATNAGRTTASKEPEGFPSLFYPGVAIDAATPIVLQDGQMLNGMNITVKRIRTSRVRGTVLEDSTSRRISAPAEIALFPFGSSPDSNWSRFFSSRDGTFDFRAVQPGKYFLNATLSGTERVLAGRRVVDIREGDNATLDVRVSPAVDIPGRFHVEGRAAGEADFPSISLILTPSWPGPTDATLARAPITLPSFSARAMPDGTFKLANVIPWDYQLVVPHIPGTYLKSARLGSTDVLENNFHVEGRPEQTLEIVLGTDYGSLDGRVLSENAQNAAAARVVLIPASRQRKDLYVSTFSSESGRFRMPDLPPGRYRAFAWKNPPDGAWMDPDFVDLYEKRGVAVEIAGGASEYVELQAIAE
jgi:hypothetical protein